jgi:hypothetical protein
MSAKPLKPATSNDFVARLGAYLLATLHREVRLRPWEGTRRLPTFLSRRYGCYTGTIHEQPCLFAIDLATVDATPAEVKKHIALIAREFDGIVVYAAQGLNANRRARLIANGIPFAVPGNQLYVPALAVDLREHFRTRPKRSPDQLSPVAQVVLFYSILFDNEFKSDSASRTPSRLATALHYSAMSVGRAFEELANAELATVKKHGRTKHIHFALDGRSLIEQARPLLRKPARTRQYAHGRLIDPPMKLAGESALSNITELSPPRLPVYAMHSIDWTAVAAANDVTIVDDPDQADSVIEFWYYRPDVLSKYVTVDPLSLYAQFWDDSNERVAKAAEEALDRVSW